MKLKIITIGQTQTETFDDVGLQWKDGVYIIHNAKGPIAYYPISGTKIKVFGNNEELDHPEYHLWSSICDKCSQDGNHLFECQCDCHKSPIKA